MKLLQKKIGCANGAKLAQWDFSSLNFYHVEQTYENLSAVFNVIVLNGVNVFTVWKDKFKTAGLFGPCILSNKRSYLHIGGHAYIEESIMDDFALSNLF